MIGPFSWCCGLWWWNRHQRNGSGWLPFTDNLSHGCISGTAVLYVTAISIPSNWIAMIGPHSWCCISGKAVLYVTAMLSRLWALGSTDLFGPCSRRRRLWFWWDDVSPFWPLARALCQVKHAARGARLNQTYNWRCGAPEASSRCPAHCRGTWCNCCPQFSRIEPIPCQRQRSMRHGGCCMKPGKDQLWFGLTRAVVFWANICRREAVPLNTLWETCSMRLARGLTTPG